MRLRDLRRDVLRRRLRGLRLRGGHGADDGAVGRGSGAHAHAAALALAAPAGISGPDSCAQLFAQPRDGCLVRLEQRLAAKQLASDGLVLNFLRSSFFVRAWRTGVRWGGPRLRSTPFYHLSAELQGKVVGRGRALKLCIIGV